MLLWWPSLIVPLAMVEGKERWSARKNVVAFAVADVDGGEAGGVGDGVGIVVVKFAAAVVAAVVVAVVANVVATV